jgi:hypothetical protein
MGSEKPIVYQITVSGELDPGWSDWLGALSVQSMTTPEGQRLTLLSGSVPDQAALRGILTQIWDLNLEVIALTRIAC